MINDVLKKIVKEENIGTIVVSIEKVIGGLSHRMYKVITDKGIYAIKELNSGVMKRPEAYSNFIFSEKVANIVKDNKIDISCAMELKGKKVIKEIDNYYFMVFEWIEGGTLKAEEILIKHCEIIGETLAKIHNINFNQIEDEMRKKVNTEEFEWNKYLVLAEKENKIYYDKLKENIDFLYNINKKSNEALNYVKKDLIISHTDLDRKNVMWKDDKPIIIDWEASGYINPTVELIQVAWYWSGGDVRKIDYDKFSTVIKAYRKYSQRDIDTNIDMLIYADIYGGLAWLEYNLRRSMCIENNYEEDEIKLAENEVIQSIEEIKYNISQIDNMLGILKR